MAHSVNPTTGTIDSSQNPWLTPEGVNSLLQSLGLVVGADGTIQQASTESKTGTQTGKTSQTATTTSPDLTALLTQIAPQLLGQAQSGDYSKAAAIRDSQGIVNQVMQNLKEQTLPQIYTAEGSRGAYNSTSKALLGNDAAARAAGQAASLVSDVATKYGQINATQNNSLIGLLNAAAQGNKTVTTTGTAEQATTDLSTGNVNKTTSAQGLADNPLIRSLGGVAAVYALLQKSGILSTSNLTKVKTYFDDMFGNSAWNSVDLTKYNNDLPGDIGIDLSGANVGADAATGIDQATIDEIAALTGG